MLLTCSVENVSQRSQKLVAPSKYCSEEKGPRPKDLSSQVSVANVSSDKSTTYLSFLRFHALNIECKSYLLPVDREQMP